MIHPLQTGAIRVTPFKKAAVAAGLCAAVIGALALTGWAAGSELLKRGLADAASMKANTAIGFVLLGLALAALAGGTRPRAVRALCAAVAVLAGLTFLQYPLGIDIGIDRLLFADAEPPYPGRMAPATALALLGLCAALPLLGAGRSRAGQACALAAGALGLIALIGYLIEAAALRAVLPFASVAPHTALGFVLLAAGALLARPDEGLMRDIAAPGLGGQAARRMLLAGGLLPPIAWLAHAGQHAGLYPDDFTLTLTAFAALAMLAAVAWFAARALNRADHALRLADSVIEGMNEGLAVTDAEGNIVRINAGFTRVTGYAEAEVLGQNPRILQSGAQGQAFYRAMWDTLRHEGHWHGEIVNRRKSGELYPELLSITALHDGAGRVSHYVGVFADLSERLLQEKQIRHLAERLDQALAAGHIGTWHFDLALDRFGCDEALLALHGLPAGEARSLAALLRHVPPAERARVSEHFERCAFEGAAFDIEYRVDLPGGERRHLAARGHARRDPGSGSLAAAGACWDITERHRSEERIMALNAGLERRVAERTAQLEAAVKELEAFSYSVAHDLRAPLRGLDGFSQILMEDYQGKLDADAHDHLRRIRAASQRMGGLIDNLLELSRLMRSEMSLMTVDLGLYARETVEELRREEPQRRVAVNIAAGLVAEADPTLARVVVDNLIHNAWKYTARREEARIDFETRSAPDGGAEFVVRDNGAGFDMRFADKLFRPFQRLHRAEDFPGSGIGLASVARAVERHGGRIAAEGKVGEGATFRFTLAPPEEERRLAA